MQYVRLAIPGLQIGDAEHRRTHQWLLPSELALAPM